MAKSNHNSEHLIYECKVSLKGLIPPIWRKFRVTSDITLHRLHLTLQTVMGWGNYHYYEFIINGTEYGEPDNIFWPHLKAARRVRLNQVVQAEGCKFIYIYDFSDDWQHVIKVEKILPAESTSYHPICLAGRRACPPEEAGGIYEYTHLLEIIENPNNEEHAEVMEWLGGAFDPEAFDVERINRVLRGIR